MQQEYQLIGLYYYVCEQYNKHLFYNVQRFSNNTTQNITDEEIMTMYLYCVCYEEKSQISSIYNHITKYWLSWFPKLPSYQSFNYRLNNLLDAFSELVVLLMESLTLPSDKIEILLGDSFPIITCSHKRAGKVAPNITSKGFCATKNMHYFGVKLHALNLRREKALPIPKFLGVTPANVHDLTALRPVLEQTHVTATYLDKAYCDKELVQNMAQNNNILITPIKNKRGIAPIIKQFDNASDQMQNTSVSKIRQPIESFFNWINELTNIQRASKIRSEKGLMVHIWGKLAAALFIFKNFNS